MSSPKPGWTGGNVPRQGITDSPREMSSPKPGWTDDQIERIMGNLLRTGVLLAAAVVLLGGVLYLCENHTAPVDYHEFRGEPADLRTVRGIVTDALALQSRGIIQLGLLLLVATPVARVVLSVLAFLRQRDYVYVLITLVVLAVLTYGLVRGR